MVKVTIADVIKQERGCVVVLLDEAGHRALPIWVGPWEGAALATGLRELPVSRPLTFTFLANLLEAADTEVEEVRIEALKEDTFYAVTKLRSGDRVREVDARPSDAIALALRTSSPIFVAEEVMEREGTNIPTALGGTSQLGKGLDSMMREIEDKWHEAKSLPPHTNEEMEKTRRELLAFVFGSET